LQKLCKTKPTFFSKQTLVTKFAKILPSLAVSASKLLAKANCFLKQTVVAKFAKILPSLAVCGFLVQKSH
jgi:hypothetical protein